MTGLYQACAWRHYAPAKQQAGPARGVPTATADELNFFAHGMKENFAATPIMDLITLVAATLAVVMSNDRHAWILNRCASVDVVPLDLGLRSGFLFRSQPKPYACKSA